LEAENTVQASFVVTEKIVKHTKSYSDGEFLQECSVAAADILHPNNYNNVYTINLDKLAADLEQNSASTPCTNTANWNVSDASIFSSV
jgi:hypothetical protein